MTKRSSVLALHSGALRASPHGHILVVGILDQCDREWLRARVSTLGGSRATRAPRAATTWRAAWTGIRHRKPTALSVFSTIFSRCRGKLRVKKDTMHRLGLRTTTGEEGHRVRRWYFYDMRAESINDGDTMQHRLVLDEDLCEHALRMFLIGYYQRLHITLEGV